ncbi:MAG: PEP-CTERM sorting domain-containing protein [Sedimenticola sp.]
MDKIFRRIAMAATLALGATAVQASPITVGGITWDPDYNANPLDPFSHEDLFVGSTLRENVVSQIGSTIGGYGEITSFNGTNNNTFCGSDCTLAYEFGGYTLSSVTYNPVTLVDGIFGFTGGWLDVYVVSTAAIADGVLDAAEKAAGLLWLSADAVADPTSGETLTGNVKFTNQGSTTNPIWLLDGSGFGYFDIVEDINDPRYGAANANFNTNHALMSAPTYTPCLNNDPILCSDLYFNSNFKGNPGLVDSGLLAFNGTADVRGDSIPEPSTLALFGASLIGFGLVRRRMKA